jgi:hypothetical protein
MAILSPGIVSGKLGNGDNGIDKGQQGIAKGGTDNPIEIVALKPPKIGGN